MLLSWSFSSRYLNFFLVISSLTWINWFPNIWVISRFLFVIVSNNSIVIWEHTLQDINRLIFIDLLYGPAYGLSWGMFHVSLKKKKVYSADVGHRVLDTDTEGRWCRPCLDLSLMQWRVLRGELYLGVCPSTNKGVLFCFVLYSCTSQ